MHYGQAQPGSVLLGGEEGVEGLDKRFFREAGAVVFYNDIHAVAVNGGAEKVDTYDFGTQTFIADTQRVGYYSLDGSGGLFLHGHLAELLVYEGVSLTRKQKNAIGYYLETKYALDTGYSPVGTLIRVQ